MLKRIGRLSAKLMSVVINIYTGHIVMDVHIEYRVEQLWQTEQNSTRKKKFISRWKPIIKIFGKRNFDVCCTFAPFVLGNIKSPQLDIQNAPPSTFTRSSPSSQSSTVKCTEVFFSTINSGVVDFVVFSSVPNLNVICGLVSLYGN